MSKHAFLIEAHSNRKQLEMLFSCLDYEENDIFIHIDKKSKGFEDLQDNNGLKHSRLYIIPSQRVYWGGYSQVKIELELMKKAMETDDYERVHLISGVDLPLISQKEMHEYFEKHKNTEFVHYDYVNDPQIYKKRMAQYHLLRDHIDRKQKILCGIEKILLVLQKIVGINRIKKVDYALYKGANWFSITGKCTRYILSKKDWIEKNFKYTKCCYEVFVQTIVANSGFSEKRYYDDLENRYGNLRFTDWERGKPYTFREEDYQELMNKAHYMFARKFDENIDFAIIEKIVKKVTNEEN